MPNSATFESFEKELNRLVETFGERLTELKSTDYNEAKLRDDFLNPFFRALGWDMENRAGLIQREREVEIESPTHIGGGRKRADYLFRAQGHDRFVCEAKKPAEELNARHAFQAKRYAWNKGVWLAVLTDFEEFKIYIVGGKPQLDEPQAGEWKSWHFRQYPLIARELWDLLSREKTGAGSIDQLIESLPKKPAGKGKARQPWLIKPDRTRSLDHDFLEFLDAARRELASDLIRQNDRAELLEHNRLNEAVQHILDRILFLRICEDRDIDTGTKLQSITDTWRKHTGNEDAGRRSHQQPLAMHEEAPAEFGSRGLRAPKDSLWRAVVRHFRALDRRPPSHVPFFNGNLFKPHFSETLVVSDEWLAGFIGELSDDETPYLFNVISVEILGSVYERFLGKVVRPQGMGVTMEDKPAVRKAGGVYYTPRYIVDYIVEQTVGRLLEGKKPQETLNLRLLDPACGSGSFLIRAYERVCEHWQRWLTADRPPKAQSAEHAAWQKKHRPLCWVEEISGDIHLTVDLKRKILTQNIFGVDLDGAAVEVTQLSLYLKMLEHENRTTLHRQRELLAVAGDIALLPPLQNNIKCGNSLIASDFSMMPEDLVRVHAFDWPVQFAAIMKAGGFDAVIGNPPYVLIDDGAEKEYLRSNYESDEGKPDLYKYFIEKSHRLLVEHGRFGMIIPASLLKTPAFRKLRALVLKLAAPKVVVAFRGPVFDQAQVNCIVLVTVRGGHSAELEWVEDESENPSESSLRKAGATAAKLDVRVWRHAVENIFSRPETAASSWLQKLSGESVVALGKVGSYTLGMQVYHNTVHSKDEMERRISHALKPGKGVWLRESRGTNVQRYCFIEDMAEWVEYGRRCYHQPGREFSKGPRIVIREITGERLNCAYTETEHMPNKAVIVFRSDSVNLKFILGLLNSRLMAKYVEATSEKGRQRLFPRISLRSVRTLPIPKLDLKNPAGKARHDKLVLLVEKMLVLTPRARAAASESEKATLQNAVIATDRQIDQLVYELYGLTPGEIALIESPEP